MQLVNETRIPNVVLRPLLAAAARKAGAKTSQVLVRIKWGWKRSNASEDTIAWTLGSRRKVTHRTVDGKRRPWRVRYTSGRQHEGLRGHVEMVLDRRLDALAFAEWFWAVAVHEWHHIAWGQQGRRYDSHDIPYQDRIHEAEAYACQEEAARNVPAKVQDMILALAEARDNLKGNR